MSWLVISLIKFDHFRTPIPWRAPKKNIGRRLIPTYQTNYKWGHLRVHHYPREVAEHALAHQLPDMVEAAYQRSSLFVKRAALMTEWAEYCATVQTDAVVKPIRGAA